MGKTLVTVVGVVAAVGIAIVAPMLAPLALGALGITATATAVAVATALITTTLSVGLSLGFRALGVGAPTTKTAVGPPQVFRQTVSNSFIVYGKRRVGGLLVFFHARTTSSPRRYWRYFVVAVAGHRCKGAVSWMLNDDIVTVNAGTGEVTSGKYAGNAWLWFVRGTDTDVANSTFVSECGGKWTSDHKGLGVAKIYAKFMMSDDTVQAGMPNITAIIEGKDDIRDPRDDTEDYSPNASMVFYDWLQTPREEGGFGAYADELPDDVWQSAQANVCDEVVNSAARYELHGVITTGAPPNEIRDVMVVNQAGSYTFSGGKHLMRPGYWVPPSVTLAEDDLAGAIQVSPFLPGDVAANEVSGTYIKPTDEYQSAPFKTQAITPPATDVRQIDLDLAFVTNKNQAERIAKIMLKRANAEKSVVWPGNLSLLKVRALDTVQLDSARYGLSNYAWTVTNWSLSADWGAVLNLREENEDIYAAPTPVAPVTPPTINPADPILTQAQITSLIQNSAVTGMTFSINTSGQVTISDHTRVYPDKSVSVTGVTNHATGGVAGDRVYVFYDDEDRSGGAVTYQHLVLTGAAGDNSSVTASATYPYRHIVANGLVLASGTTTGGSGTGAGTGGGPSGICVTTDTLILLAGGGEIEAGNLKAGMFVRTQHELTLQWGDYRIDAVRVERDLPVMAAEIDGRKLRATPEHRIWIDGEWVRMRDIGTPDGTADVVKITVAEAHTYISNGLLSHNVKVIEP